MMDRLGGQLRSEKRGARNCRAACDCRRLFTTAFILKTFGEASDLLWDKCHDGPAGRTTQIGKARGKKLPRGMRLPQAFHNRVHSKDFRGGIRSALGQVP